MINVGVIGIGTMGTTHLDVYRKRTDAKVIAVSDLIAERRNGKARATGNIEGQAQGGFDYASAKQYDEGMKLIADPDVQLVDICLPTPLHAEYAIAALKAGKHVLVEKPLARNPESANELRKVSEAASTLSMCAMCMRFWPGWTWLKETVDKKTYGKVLGAQFRRLASFPGGPFYSDGAKSGGAVLDLHIHDTDFIHYCFGVPDSVSTAGYSNETSEPDHVMTHYRYKDIPLVTAEGGWGMAPGFGFRMQYIVNFEKATASFDIAAEQKLTLCERGQSPRAVNLEPGMGYEFEIAYFLDCIKNNRRPTTVTLQQAAQSVAIVAAEVKSMRSGAPVAVERIG